MKSFSFLLYGSIVDPRGTRRIDHASRGERAVQTASYLLAASDADTFMLDVRETDAGPTKFRFNKTQLGLKRALQSQSHADRQSDIVFILSIRLEPTKTLQGSG
jgi:hypothetical protein